MEADSEQQSGEWSKEMSEGAGLTRPMLLGNWKTVPQTSQRNNAKTPLRNRVIQ